MTLAEIQAYCRKHPGAKETLFPPPKNILWYAVAGKQFAYFKTSEPEQWRFSIRVMPERFLELTDIEGVKPARYMHRFHWVTIVDPHEFNTGYLQELIDWSYDRALRSLSRKKQNEILAYP